MIRSLGLRLEVENKFLTATNYILDKWNKRRSKSLSFNDFFEKLTVKKKTFEIPKVGRINIEQLKSFVKSQAGISPMADLFYLFYENSVENYRNAHDSGKYFEYFNKVLLDSLKKNGDYIGKVKTEIDAMEKEKQSVLDKAISGNPKLKNLAPYAKGYKSSDDFKNIEKQAEKLGVNTDDIKLFWRYEYGTPKYDGLSNFIDYIQSGTKLKFKPITIIKKSNKEIYAKHQKEFEMLFTEYISGDDYEKKQAKNKLQTLQAQLDLDGFFLEVEFKKFMKSYKVTPEKIIPISTVFDIPKHVPTDYYQLTRDFSGVKSWKAKILSGNNTSKGQKVGDWDSVGYVMFSLKDNTIIPIARGDEHHTGYDTLQDEYRQFGIRSNDFYSLFTMGSHYTYGDDLDSLIIVCEKYLKWNGDPNLTIVISGVKKISIKAKDIIKYKGNIKKLYSDYTEVKNKLLPYGQEFLDKWKALSILFQKNQGAFEKSIVNKLAIETKKLVNYISDNLGYEFGFFENQSREVNKVITDLVKEGDFYELENFVFGFLKPTDMNRQLVEKAVKDFTGLKNYFHTKLRKAKPDGIADESLFSKIGDVNMLIKMMGDL